MKRPSEESIPFRNNIQAVLNSTELSGTMAREIITISSNASPEPSIVTIDSDSNEPTMPYGFGSQNPIVPANLNDLNLPPNHFNVLTSIAVIRADEEYSSNHRSHLSCLQWMWVPLKAGRQRIQQITMPHFILTMSPDETIGIFRQATLSTPMSQEMFLSLRALPPLRLLHEDKKGSWA